ncbi:sodium ion-translocating decarboxylase subunit beta [Novipirellula artificiosorum]|uniref:Glutaconyl-CoA decarboxylase subunit beta n=1 Tax=Novipirellula artificiosorum TaxID=2528016 RepID=A0A5C6D3X8_9BACT|nr:sodium ion-translocating decarboxylase subunit beta [Novipirellula artificiosorum]TWU30584.1 Glutaconyl-CoA decarboxylase subunit beta [Novipirellula artificiosorum]
MRPFPILIVLCCSAVVHAAGSAPTPPDVPSEMLDPSAGYRIVYLPGDYEVACELLHELNATAALPCRVPSLREPNLRDLGREQQADPSEGWQPVLDAFETETPVAFEFPLFTDRVESRGKMRPSGVLVLLVPESLRDCAEEVQYRLDSLYLSRGYSSVPRPKQVADNDSLVTMLSVGLGKLWNSSGVAQIGWDFGNYLMIGVALLLFYLGIAKGFEPLLLVPIAMGCVFVNSVGANMTAPPSPVGNDGGLLYYFFFYGITTGIFPLLIFLGVGALTDFGPLLANPWSALLGAAAQFGIFGTFLVAASVGLFTLQEAGAIAIIGGADGPTSIYVASKLAPDLLGAIAVAAYSYMALVPIIQPPIMKWLTNDAERKIMMEQRRPVSQKAKILFPIAVFLLCLLALPDALPLIGMLMFGNLLRESGVTERLSKTAQNELINLVTIALGLAVGTKLSADAFLNPRTLMIVVLGCAAFMVGTAAGVLMAKLMNKLSGGRINPLIGSAGVSAVPMAARVSQIVGSQYNRQNMLLMHAMGPNVAGVIGSAVAAGILISLLG